MQNFNIVKNINLPDTYRVKYIKSKFDFNDDKIELNLKLDNINLPIDWNMGVIVGNSGSGKSTIAKEIYKIDNFLYSSSAVIDDMPKNITNNEIIETFNKVGFSSPPSWLKPYNILSNGEKMRVDLANSILSDKDIIAFDEFTSVLDRNVAKIASYSIQKYIRKYNKKFVAISCHFDIIEWLEPDWILNTNTMDFYMGTKSPTTKDLQLKSNFINAQLTNGNYLGNIII